ncbi:SAM-dependent methyltransferase [Youhaiella tibetensis]|uniref:Class I SAM-dependent methyltransferase n=1 Tax=Paradevosia tibetensis TaxID=1447062 RepID=A0A5B9DT68_9HYPH|nr:class I SAM-dependent methyltransferase [Youhaiella tibetensis]QEE22367.1 class I SAM-dependent methyltransferase [Youhaiella tibetensis]GGF42886.1 SAM-dependent methyltransferase [Youhaiella tibetensis]
MQDDETLKFYAENARAYAGRGRRPAKRLGAFLAALPPGARVLELGTGGGQDARAMLDAGLEVTPTDGSAELAREAEKLLGRPVRVMRFDELDEVDAYDGIWAAASLLHAPRRTLTGILTLVHRAMRPGATFVASFKGGQAEGRDGFGRYYNYFDGPTLLRHFEDAADWENLEISQELGSGYDGKATDWLWVTARRR